MQNISYSARSAFAGESRTAGQASGMAAKKSSEADSFSKLVDDSQAAGGATSAAKAAKSSHHFTFKDFILGLLDIINPLQHIPVVSTIYRKMTGDEISPMARVAGDALYGGPIGAAVGLADVAVEKATGKDIGQNVMALVNGNDGDDNAVAKTQVASANPRRSENDDRTASASRVKQDDIIWDDDMQQAALKLTVRPQRTDAVRSEGLRNEMLKQKMNAPAPAAAAAPLQKTHQRPSLTSPAAQALLQAQQVPRDQVAQKMMEGLDKYRAMQHRGTAQ